MTRKPSSTRPYRFPIHPRDIRRLEGEELDQARGQLELQDDDLPIFNICSVDNGWAVSIIASKRAEPNADAPMMRLYGRWLLAWLFQVQRASSYGPILEQRFIPPDLKMVSISCLDPGKTTIADIRALWASGRKIMAYYTGHAGGRPEKTFKGILWTRQNYLDWYVEASQFGEPSLLDLAIIMGVSDDTVRSRLRAPGVALPWPPEAHQHIWNPDDL